MGKQRWVRPRFVLGFLLFAAPFLLVTPNWVLSTDGACYMTAGESLSSGKGYLTLGGIWMKYPPLYPALIALLLKLPGNIHCWLSALNTLAFGMGCWLSYLYLAIPRKGDSRSESALLAAGLTATAAACWSLIPESCTYVVVLPFQMATLLVARRLMSPDSRGLRDTLLLALLVGEALLLRSASVAVLAALMAWACWPSAHIRPGDQKLSARPRGRLVVLACLLGLLFSVAFRAALTAASPASKPVPQTVPEGISYLREFREVAFPSGDHRLATLPDFARRILDNSTLLILSMGDLLLPGSLGHRAPTLAMLALLLVGYGLDVTRKRTPEAVFLPVHCAMLVSFQGTHEKAYLIPLLPFLFRYLLDGVECLSGLLRQSCSGGAVAFTALALLSAQFPATREIVVREFDPHYDVAANGQDGSDFLTACQWVSGHLPSDAVLTATRAPIVAYLGRRTAFSEPTLHDPAEVLRAIESAGTTHVLASPIHRWTRDFLLPAIRARPERFRLLFRRGTTSVFQLLGPE